MISDSQMMALSARREAQQDELISHLEAVINRLNGENVQLRRRVEALRNEKTEQLPEAGYGDILDRLLDRIQHLNEEQRLLREENAKLTDETRRIVQCKDCRFGIKAQYGVKCQQLGYTFSNTWYCANGDRINEED